MTTIAYYDHDSSTFYNCFDDLYHEITTYMYDGMKDIPDDFEIELYLCDLEPLMTVDDRFVERVTEIFCEERLSENRDELSIVIKLLTDNINMKAINKDMPKLYYPNYSKKVIFTKKDFKEY